MKNVLILFVDREENLFYSLHLYEADYWIGN